MVVAGVERFEHESMYGLPAGTKKPIVVERWPLAEVRVYFAYYTCCFLNFLVVIVVAVVLTGRFVAIIIF